MASVTVPRITVVRQDVLPIVIRPASISQEEIAHICELRRQMAALDERLKEAEIAVRGALESGADVEPGIFHAHLKVTERRSVAWKAVCERELGEAFCTRVLAATKPESYSTLQIGA